MNGRMLCSKIQCYRLQLEVSILHRICHSRGIYVCSTEE